jgi:hypothetical protein
MLLLSPPRRARQTPWSASTGALAAVSPANNSGAHDFGAGANDAPTRSREDRTVTRRFELPTVTEIVVAQPPRRARQRRPTQRELVEASLLRRPKRGPREPGSGKRA